ncbi:hypothetical protein KR093_007005 [Drosophila rubida]|uniref:Uncharacterized protein n=1 Tax=Drosophila rubida TaxID=30044 RepID=A0AAD4JX13_9MUSC|nr:hypothetical protein KR093_007005 [Drosophila rubida]
MFKHIVLWSTAIFAVVFIILGFNAIVKYTIRNLSQCVAHVTFTNLKCTFSNESYGEFKVCHIKAVNRTHKYISVYQTLNIVIDNVIGNLKVMRFDNGYKPYFIDVTIDICKFLKYPKNPIAIVFYKIFKKDSNMNHTCPYDHDIIVDKVWTGNLESDLGRYLPIPNGDYAIYATFYHDSIEFNTVNIYIRKS